jgi:hypothetical protein
MTAALLTDAPGVIRPHRFRSLWAVPAGTVLGLALGVVARLWMRLISDDPEFSWSGTLFIVIAFGVFGTGQGLAWAARHVGWRRPGVTAARVLAVVLALPIFAGAGAIMLPTVYLGSLACWRADWSRRVRAVVGAFALPAAGLVVVGIVDKLGWSVRSVTGVVAFAAVYGVVIAALQPAVAPLDDGWHLRRTGRIVVCVIGLVLAALVASSLRGI